MAANVSQQSQETTTNSNDNTTENSNNHIEGRLQAALYTPIAPKEPVKHKRFRFHRKRSTGGGLAQEPPTITVFSAERLPLPESPKEEEVVTEQQEVSKLTGTDLSSLKRVGFLIETATNDKSLTESANNFEPSTILAENVIDDHILKENNQSDYIDTIVKKIIKSFRKPNYPKRRNYSNYQLVHVAKSKAATSAPSTDFNLAVKAAKILTSPQKGQIALDRIELSATKIKSAKKKTKPLKFKENIGGDIGGTKTLTTEGLVEKEKFIIKSNRKQTKKKSLLSIFDFKSETADRQLAGLDKTNINNFQQNKKLPLKNNSCDLSSGSKGIAPTTKPILPPKPNSLNSKKASHIEVNKTTNAQNNRLFSKPKVLKISPTAGQKNLPALPFRAVTPIKVPQKLIPKFTTNLKTYNLNKEKPVATLVKPSESFLKRNRLPKFHLRYVIMEKKKAKNDDDKNDKKSSSSPSTSPPSTSRKRKIIEETTAKTSSEAAASAGPSTSTEPAEDDKDKEDDKDAKKKKNRCSECRKKVGLTGFLCRCGGLYCAVHRYSDKHNCTFDYREHGAQEIRRNNPVVVGEKIQKI